MKKNIVFFVTSLNSGGIENYLLRFLTEYGVKFNHIYILCKSGESGQLEAEYKSIENITILKQRLRYINCFDYLILSRILTSRNIDIVCDFTGNFSGLVMLTAASLNIDKRVTWYRGATDHFSPSILKLIYNNTLKHLVRYFSTDILSNSESALYYFYKNKWVDNSKYRVIYNGINSIEFKRTAKDIRKDLGIPRDAFIVGHVGRYNEAKNHDTIFRVAIELISKHKDIYFILCGNNVDKMLGSKVKSIGLSDRILTFENRRDISSFIKTTNCFYFPSITEGQPNALIEAWIIGVPFVASNIPSISEITPIEFKSQLINPKDHSAAVKKILEIKHLNLTNEDFNISRWASKRFNHNSQFLKFYKVLVDEIDE